MTNLFSRISEEIKSAMLAKDKVRLEALRSAKKEFLEAMTAKGSNGTLADDKALQIITKMIKQREESATIYRGQNRPDLAETEEQQAEVLRGYLPEQMTAEEVERVVRETAESLGIADMKGMGRLMGEVSKSLAGRAEGKMIAEIVKKILGPKA